jgi:hypothetical protein
VAIIDWASRAVLAWRLSNTMEVTFCAAALDDNVSIERLWRWLKYEEVYLKGYADGRAARAGIASGFAADQCAGRVRLAGNVVSSSPQALSTCSWVRPFVLHHGCETSGCIVHAA